MIKTVGYNRFGFDSEVDVDLLRSLYLVSILIAKAGIRLMEPRPQPMSRRAPRSLPSPAARSKATAPSRCTTRTPTQSSTPLSPNSLPSVSCQMPTESEFWVSACCSGSADFCSHRWCRIRRIASRRQTDAARPRGHRARQLLHWFQDYRECYYIYIADDQTNHWIGHPNFEMVRHDVVEPFLIEVDREFKP